MKTNLTLEVCSCKAHHTKFKDIIDTHHSYIKHKKTPTRRINWLVKDGEEVIGAIGINSCTLNLAARDKFIGFKDNKEKLAGLNNYANNYRFCLMPGVAKNTASQVLKLMRKAAKFRWQEKYGFKLKGIETFVKRDLNGSCYRADNWKFLGETTGISMSRVPTKLIAPKTYAKLYKNIDKIIKIKVEPKKIFFIEV